MFVSDAHSVTQQSRLAITLAWIAGYTNAVTLLSCDVATSHVSGTADNLGIGLASYQWQMVSYCLFLLTCFVLGAALSGVTTELGRRRHWESIYVLPIALQAVLLTGFALCVEFVGGDHLRSGGYLYLATGLASLAMGLQNATITRISKGVVRTTHVTGVLTDLGLEGVHYLLARKDRQQGRVVNLGDLPAPTGERLLLLLSIVGSFAFGAALGSTGYLAYPMYAMFPPVLFLMWIIFVDIRKPIAEIAATDLAAQLGLTECAVFKLQRDSKRAGKDQRMPNLAAWASMLAPGVKFVVLDLSEIGTISDNSLQELSRLGEQLNTEGRSLSIAGYKPRLESLTSTPRFYPNVQQALKSLSSN